MMKNFLCHCVRMWRVLTNPVTYIKNQRFKSTKLIGIVKKQINMIYSLQKTLYYFNHQVHVSLHNHCQTSFLNLTLTVISIIHPVATVCTIMRVLKLTCFCILKLLQQLFVYIYSSHICMCSESGSVCSSVYFVIMQMYVCLKIEARA